MGERKVIDELIIETKPLEEGLTYLIYGKLKRFDNAGNLILSEISKIEKFNILKFDNPSKVGIPYHYNKSEEIHIQRQTVSKIIVISKKDVDVKDHG